MQHLSEVRRLVLQNLKGTAAVASVLAGEADPGVYSRYLTNVWHYAQHSATVIGLAGSRCVHEHPKLADYLLHHAREELGHEKWAIDDLAALGLGGEALEATRPTTSCAAMIGFEYYIAGHANPVGLFGWLYVLESMGDDLGGVVSDRIRESLDVPSGVKFLQGHGEADEEHTKDIIEQIERNVCPADLPDVHYVADVVAELYVRMFHELTEEFDP